MHDAPIQGMRGGVLGTGFIGTARIRACDRGALGHPGLMVVDEQSLDLPYRRGLKRLV